jgi:outer membrane protein assembly factor BamB
MAENCKIRTEALDAYLHGMLNEAQQRELNAHLLVCPQCNRTLSALEAETYTLSKGLRDVPAPPMNVSAADLVAQYADQPLAKIEKTGERRRVRKEDSRVIRLAGQAAATTSHAVGFVQRYGLLKVAAIAFSAGLIVWFGVTTARKIDSMAKSIAELTDRERSQEAERLQRERDQLTQLKQELNDLSDRQSRTLVRQQTLHDVEYYERLNGLGKTLADVQSRLENEVATYKAQLTDLKRSGEQQEKDRLNHETESKVLEAQLEQLRHNLEALRKADGQDAALADASDARELRLVPEEGIQIAFDKNTDWANETMYAQPLSCRGGNIGWAMALGSVRITPSVLTPGPGKAGERIFDGAVRSQRADPQRCVSPSAFNGKVFIPNGLAEGEMVAIEGSTGKPVWAFAVHDTIGAPVVTDEGTLYFTTERGTVYAINDTKTRLGGQGTEQWHKFLGAASTQPAFDDKNIFVVHKSEFSGRPAGDMRYQYSLTCMKSDFGGVQWTRGLNADAISSPVACDGRVYVATRDGNLTAYDYSGKWITINQKEKISATSAPVTSGNTLYFSAWESHPRFGFTETLEKFSIDAPTAKETLAGPFRAAYFNAPAASGAASEESDVSPGEYNGLPVMHDALTYLGGRPTIVDQNAFVAIGDHLVCWDLKQNRARWSCQVTGKSEGTLTAGHGQPPLTPPSYSNGKLYLGSIWGDVVCINAENGKLAWRYRLDGSRGISSQLVLDQGRAYATTANGMLLCIETSDSQAGGWHSWGGTAGHNGVHSK